MITKCTRQPAPFLIGSLLALVLLTGGCSQSVRNGAGIDEKEKKEIQSAVINRFNGLMKYAEAGELENVLMHFDSAGPGSYIDGGMRFQTLQEMVDYYRANWRVEKQDFGIPDTKMFVLSPQMVLVSSTATLHTTLRGGIQYQPRPWSVTTLWKWKGDQWQIHSWHQFSGEPKRVEEKKDDKA
jgi:hypothetical protein